MLLHPLKRVVSCPAISMKTINWDFARSAFNDLRVSWLRELAEGNYMHMNAEQQLRGWQYAMGCLSLISVEDAIAFPPPPLPIDRVCVIEDRYNYALAIVQTLRASVLKFRQENPELVHGIQAYLFGFVSCLGYLGLVPAEQCVPMWTVGDEDERDNQHDEMWGDIPASPPPPVVSIASRFHVVANMRRNNAYVMALSVLTEEYQKLLTNHDQLSHQERVAVLSDKRSRDAHRTKQLKTIIAHIRSIQDDYNCECATARK